MPKTTAEILDINNNNFNLDTETKLFMNKRWWSQDEIEALDKVFYSVPQPSALKELWEKTKQAEIGVKK